MQTKNTISETIARKKSQTVDQFIAYVTYIEWAKKHKGRRDVITFEFKEQKNATFVKKIANCVCDLYRVC